MWRVVGGGRAGGIVVRQKRGVASKECKTRLSVGSLVTELENVDGRLHYKLLSGEGPKSGWVSTQFSGKDLLVRVQEKEESPNDSQDETESTSAGSTSADEVALPTDTPCPVKVGDICVIKGEIEQDDVLVWEGNDTSSCICGNISIGSVVKVRDCGGERTCYSMVAGTGSKSGWVNSAHVVPANVWQVVGGSINGGILVRQTQDVVSEKYVERLSVGSLISELELSEGRLHYQLLNGQGPAIGWVSLTFAGKTLLKRFQELDQVQCQTEKEPDQQQEVIKVENGQSADANVTSWLNAGSILSNVWEVTGGARAGGILVRECSEIGSAKYQERLSLNSIILEVQREDDRIKYELLSGNGPASGWVSTHFSGKPLLSQVQEADEAKADKCVKAMSHKVLSMYGNRVGEVGERRVLALPGAQKKEQPDAVVKLEADLSSALVAKASRHGQFTRALTALQSGWSLDDEGEDVFLCSHCLLPVGKIAYDGDTDACFMHGECTAQFILQDIKRQEDARLLDDRALKLKHRAEYDIGWKAARVPRNDGPAKALKCPVPAGMCCIVYDEATHSVSLKATVEPAGAVNLEYLSTALKVRQLEGHEPWFSLDPIDTTPTCSLQKKIFDPKWLQGTSLGEVMFQADYHLKELSMGEYDMPIVGMKSVFDYCRDEEVSKWRGREWFVVNKAEVQMSEDNVVVPYFEMGIQARETQLGKNGMEDVPVTRKNHPLVKFADHFTENFDLIAERKSVINQLREVAKASIVAKYLMDSKVSLDDEWFSAHEAKPETCVMELPQLWNMRGYSRIQTKDGNVVDGPTGVEIAYQGVFGGVQFGLDRFKLGGPARAIPVSQATAAAPMAGLSRTVGMAQLRPITAPTSAMPTLRAPAQFAASVSALKPAPVSMTRMPPAAGLTAMRAPAASVSAVARPTVPLAPPTRQAQGVDLNLSKFDLSAPACTTAQMGSCSADLDSIEAKVSIGDAFWASVDSVGQNVFKDEHNTMFQQIFNTYMCDRRTEGDVSMPPDTRVEYVRKLKKLIKREDALRQQRKEHFMRPEFKKDNPGELFPKAWTQGIKVVRGETSAMDVSASTLQRRDDYKAQEQRLELALKTATPIFEKTAEEGCTFRIYSIGNIEVRTTQEHKGKEEILAVFSTEPLQKGAATKKQPPKDDARIAKITVFVEATSETKEGGRPCYHYYTLLETDAGASIVTEKFNDGRVTWQENPLDLQARNSLAKTVCSTESKIASSCCVEDLKLYQQKVNDDSDVSSKRYAQGAYAKATATDVEMVDCFKPEHMK